MSKMTRGGPLSESWFRGPVNDIALSPQHDRTILSLDILGDKVVTSSADHSLKVYNM